jgi:lipopolysaccharide/colanic/teichoic acid biosynthesis glycosyltransferase
MYQHIVKPLLDRIVGLVAFMVLSPIIVLITLLLWIANQGNPFFVQPRPGKNARIFHLIKFKTMNDKTDDDGNLLPDEYRLTPLGRFIRKTSLDELPQLINVIKGDMSIVGPRPLLVEYLPLYSKEQARRHEVKPGITGWAQVNGRNAISWEQKFKLDVWYVDHQSFLLDLQILWMTVSKVFAAKGINAQNAATMEKFTGNNY